MTEPGSHEQELLPERAEEVRRLLAEARHDGGLPADVAVRLDRVLEELAASDPRDLRAPAELAARRRRRVRHLLVAAAAVGVIGIGLGQVLPGVGEDVGSAVTADSAGGSVSAGADAEAPAAAADGTSSLASSSAAGAAEGESATDDADAPETMVEESLEGATASSAGGGLVAYGKPVRVRVEHFAADADRARDRVDAGRRGRPRPPQVDCEPASWGPGTAVAVLYGGRPHVLVFRAPAGDTQVVDLLQCGTGETLRSTTLPAG